LKKSIKSIRLFSLFILGFGILVTNVNGQDAQTDHKSVKKDWGFSITPYALLASQSTDVGGEKLRQSFTDLYSLTNGGFQIVGVARYKRLFVAFDGTFANLGQSLNEEPLLLNLNIDQNILDFKVGYTVYENYRLNKDEVLQGWDLSFNAGAKYWKNDLTLDYSFVLFDQLLSSGSINELEDWWDLMVGVKTNFVISKKFMITVMGDAGGFGFGNSSKFAYDFTYLNSFKVSKLITINAGFQNFRYHRIDGTGEDELETTVNVLGPVLGISFIF
jgi:hypothetical protein